jgi:hypothetical protein
MNESTIKAIQSVLFPNNPEEVDGKWGKRSQAALDAVVHLNGLIGDGTWDFLKAKIDGDDIVIEPGPVTAFGGDADTVDGVFKGQTASGMVNTTKQPDYIGCSLPMRRDDSKNLRGSPIPKLPWLTTVVFTNPSTGVSVNTKLIDEGPAKWTKHIGDLTVAAARLFDKHATANNFTQTLGIRIVGGAQFVK